MSILSDPVGLRVVGAVPPAVSATLGSMPAWFRLSQDTTVPHVAWVNGTSSWADDVRTALADGALVVLVDRPGKVSGSDLDGFANQPVVLVGSRTHAPQVRALASILAPLATSVGWVEVLVVDGSLGAFEPAAALWDATAMLTALGLGIDSVPKVATGAGVVTADATVGSTRVHLSCVHRPGMAPRATIKAFGGDWSAEASMGDPAVGFPGEVLAVGTRSASQSSTTYETPRRVALDEVHSGLTGDLEILPGLTKVHAHATHLLNQVVWDDSQSATQLKWKETD